MPDVIVVIPGILGSVLQKHGKDVWALSPGAVLRGLVPGGAGVEDLILDADPPDVEDLGDGIVATSLFPDTHLVPGLWKIDGYSRVADSIQRVFDVTPGRNYFEFPYDWRRDNRVAATRMDRLSRQWLKAWRDSSGNVGARLILIAHSMGGLVARHFLEVLGGWEDTRALVTFGTPYRGAVNALNFIANGFKKTLGPIPLVDLSEVLRSLTAVYQLLQIYPCYDAGDGHLVRVEEAANIPHLDAKKAAEALKFHYAIRDAVSVHRSDHKYRDEGYQIYPIVGTHQDTLQSARLEGGVLRAVAEYAGRDLDGDGTVPRVSATPIELSDEHREFFAAQKHGALQNSAVGWVQLEGILKSTQLDLSIFKAGPVPARQQNRLRLAMDDAFGTDEPVRVRVRPEWPLESVQASIVNVATNQGQTLDLSASQSAWLEGEAPPLPVGTYRITVSGERSVVPVSDVFLVA
ncbi:MAG: hypothetical protein A3G25_13960 [Betaproteobacteria bacterium RIFCSPLOWO2_12_FULL_63_13]|nr:MAG: hypothetical protein A3G25_13960 [Betaproteobacteria bacterium RIFCSPLOWO2_12_FULL_63_13]